MKKKIVIVTSQLPYPLFSGGSQAQYNFIDILRHEHEISIIFPENGKNTMPSMRQLQALWPEVKFFPYSYMKQMTNPEFAITKAIRAFNLKFRKEALDFKVERILKPYGFDLSDKFVRFVEKVLKDIQADIMQIDFYPFLGLAKMIKTDVRKLFIHHEIRYMRNKRMLSQLGLNAEDIPLYNRIKEQEINDLNTYDAVVTLTDIDSAILANEGVTTTIKTSPAAISTNIQKVCNWNNVFAFVGSASHGPNQEGISWFTNEVLPLIDWKKYQHCTFDLVGRGWDNTQFEYPQTLEVSITGFVENLADILLGSIMVVPILSGSGMRMKILEGAALGLPIITTTVGMEGLTFKPGRDCLVADTAEEFAMCMERLFTDQQERMRLANNAQEVFRKHYSRKCMAEIRGAIYNKL